MFNGLTTPCRQLPDQDWRVTMNAPAGAALRTAYTYQVLSIHDKLCQILPLVTYIYQSGQSRVGMVIPRPGGECG